MKENDNWGTPKWVAEVVLRSVRARLGGDTVVYDVSSRDGYAAPGMTACRGVDFLDRSTFKMAVPDRWRDRFGWFVNPPFSELGKWVEAASQFPEVLYMIAPYTPDSKWWMKHIEPNIGMWNGVDVFSLGRVRLTRSTASTRVLQDSVLRSLCLAQEAISPCLRRDNLLLLVELPNARRGNSEHGTDG